METYNFGLYDDKELFYTNGESFISHDWVDSEGRYCGDSCESHLDVILAHDGRPHGVHKHHIEAISEEQLLELFTKAHPALRVIYEIDRIKKPLMDEIDWLSRRCVIADLIESGRSEKELINRYTRMYMLNAYTRW